MANKRLRRNISKQHINFVLPSDVKRELEQRADEQMISTSHLIRQLIRAYLKNGASRPASTQSHLGGAGNASRAA